ncbi:MAG: hypothetical protein HYX66_06700 [Ignavibacteria bacterium]|nr:hypothetical protein [Ignavibacteria bacterium]
MKTPKSILLTAMALQGFLFACSTAPDEEDAVIQLQYRIKSSYTSKSKRPEQGAIARAHIYTKSKYRPKVAVTASFDLNGKDLQEAGEGSYLLNEAAILEKPYVLNWTIAGYGDSTVRLADTVDSPMLLSPTGSTDTVPKRTGASIVYASTSATNATSDKRVYCLIMLDQSTGERSNGDDSHAMFDQSDNGRIDLTPAILEGLKPNRRYVLSVERGSSKQFPNASIRIVSSSFSEVTTTFFLGE